MNTPQHMTPVSTTTRNLNWKYALGEIFLITTGITIAFLLNAWWENNLDTQAARELLVAFRQDFETTLDGAEATIQWNDDVLQATEQLLQLTGPEPPEIDAEQGIQMLASVMVSGDSFPVTEATLNLLGADVLGSLPNYDLQLRLSKWPRFRSNMIFFDDRIADLYRERILPYLAPKFPTRLVDPNLIEKLGKGHFPGDISVLLSDVEFENLLADLHYYYSRYRDAVLDAEAEIEAIIELIDTQLGAL